MRKSLSLLLAFLGLFDSLYLFWIYTSPARTMVCVGTGCDTVRLSAYSHLGGVPMPVYGVIGYVLIVLLIVAESLATPALAGKIRYALAGATGFGFVFSAYLEYVQGFVLHAFCAWCVTSGVVMTLLCALAAYDVIQPGEAIGSEARISRLRGYYLLGVASMVVGVPAFYVLAKHGEAPPPPPPTPTESTASRLVRPDSHAMGNSNAALTVVEFGDFECPVCGREAPVAKQIRAQYSNRVRFVFRQFPLIHTHPFAQRMAEASECAADQGKFWESIDVIYAHQDDLSEDALKHDAAELGLDSGHFNQCMDTGATAARVSRDREDGKALGVNATPTFFIGRKVLSGAPDFDEFSKAIEQELAAQGSAIPPSPPTSSATVSKSATTSAPVTKPTRNANPAPVIPAADPGTSPFGTLGSTPGSALGAFQTGVACSEDDAKQKQPTLIDTKQLRGLVTGNSRPVFVDVRSGKEFAAGSIPGAINIPVDDMPKRWDSLPKDRTIVFFESGKSSGDICASGRAAGRILLQNGYAFDRVKVYQDGLAGWNKSGLGAETLRPNQ
jgi:protein-disulfide isomerase/rhodanese-related sulfurtransferase/uncharacterized membrane protein